jgi:hypothetical protein
VYLHLMQFSVTTKVMQLSDLRCRGAAPRGREL